MRTTTLVVGMALALLLAACNAGTDPDMAQRVANIEGRVADLEAARAQTTDGEAAQQAPDDTDQADQGGAADQAQDQALSEKEMFAAAVAREELGEQLQDAVPDAAVDDVRFDDATETLVVSADAEGTDIDGAWQMAQALAPLWEELDRFQPVLDLKVGDIRCACSSRLMKDVGNGTADRAAWEGACDEA